MEEVDSADQKSKEDRSETAKKRFETQKIKAKSELESIFFFFIVWGNRSTPIFNKHQSVRLNKNQGQLPSFNKKEN